MMRYRINAVALRKESVDRNVQIIISGYARERSLSARRAWIEIPSRIWRTCCTRVALRKESVDRNYIIKITVTPLRRSLSARRAWIEISEFSGKNTKVPSLSARRAWIEIFDGVPKISDFGGRSPQGERG